MAFVNNDFGDVLLHRESVRDFDPSVKIPREELQQMISEAITAPSACNLQAWHFVIVDDEAGKDKLRSYFMKFNKPQLDSCSAMIQIFGDTLAFKAYRDLWNKACEDGRITPEKRDEVLNTFLPLYEKAPKSMLVNDSTVDSTIAATQLMLIARAHGYESNPIGGYDTTKAAKVFGLDPERYVPVMAVALGKPAKNGKDEMKSARYPASQVIEFA
ncbi:MULTISPECIES: nitroreductase family protein [Lacticaseibacillus]|uniref:Nitroreductase family protein n=1 Tax=Lacticaseibacillus hegangensis TaxID=2486010 RepID=A0ABW4CUD8_9LACO|nr:MULTISPECIES: nitroreductase family protein [Lacticaseibacillus]